MRTQGSATKALKSTLYSCLLLLERNQDRHKIKHRKERESREEREKELTD